jgi:hypothetical protein
MGLPARKLPRTVYTQICRLVRSKANTHLGVFLAVLVDERVGGVNDISDGRGLEELEVNSQCIAQSRHPFSPICPILQIEHVNMVET